MKVYFRKNKASKTPLCERKYNQSIIFLVFFEISAYKEINIKHVKLFFFVIKVKFNLYVKSIDFYLSPLKLHGPALCVLV